MNRLPAALIALVPFTASAFAQSYPSSWKLAHPDAKALIGVDVRGLRESQVAKLWGGEVEKTGFGMFRFPGMELLKEIDQVFISSPGGKTSNAKENPPFLAVLTGHFSPDHVREVLQGTHHTYKTVEIYGTPSAKPGSMSLVQLAPSTILLGDELSLRGAIDRRSQSGPAPEGLLARASAMAASHDFWLITTVSPSAFQPANMNLAGLLSEIRAIDAGFSLREGFRLELGLNTKTSAGASELAQQFSAQLKSALAMNVDDQQGADIIRKLDISSEGTRMGVKMALSKDEVDQLIRTAQAKRQNARVAKAQPVDDRPKTIKIFGLDDGVREIPLSSGSKH